MPVKSGVILNQNMSGDGNVSNKSDFTTDYLIGELKRY
jgi:hypothetical protein